MTELYVMKSCLTQHVNKSKMGWVFLFLCFGAFVVGVFCKNKVVCAEVKKCIFYIKADTLRSVGMGSVSFSVFIRKN